MPTLPWSRRDFLCGCGASAVATAVTGTARRLQAAEAAPTGSFEAGMRLGPCRLVRVLPVEQGALPFELEDAAGVRFVVEVHEHDEGVRGLRRAGAYDVFLRNGGSGSTPTNEAHGLAAMALAALLMQRQANGRPIPPDHRGTLVERPAAAVPVSR